MACSSSSGGGGAEVRAAVGGRRGRGDPLPAGRRPAPFIIRPATCDIPDLIKAGTYCASSRPPPVGYLYHFHVSPDQFYYISTAANYFCF